MLGKNSNIPAETYSLLTGNENLEPILNFTLPDTLLHVQALASQFRIFFSLVSTSLTKTPLIERDDSLNMLLIKKLALLCSGLSSQKLKDLHKKREELLDEQIDQLSNFKTNKTNSLSVPVLSQTGRTIIDTYDELLEANQKEITSAEKEVTNNSFANFYKATMAIDYFYFALDFKKHPKVFEVMTPYEIGIVSEIDRCAETDELTKQLYDSITKALFPVYIEKKIGKDAENKMAQSFIQNLSAVREARKSGKMITDSINTLKPDNTFKYKYRQSFSFSTKETRREKSATVTETPENSKSHVGIRGSFNTLRRSQLATTRAEAASSSAGLIPPVTFEGNGIK